MLSDTNWAVHRDQHQYFICMVNSGLATVESFYARHLHAVRKKQEV